MKKIYLGLGSNLGDREKYLMDAISYLEKSGIRTLKKSSILETEPLGGFDQPKYLNMVIEVATEFCPEDLLKKCQKVEDDLGRKRAEKWASRTIDIDILIYGDEKISKPDLVIPHPGVKNRDFVQAGLAELGEDMHSEPFT